MTDRYERLEAARRIDWRFLLPTPRLRRVAWVGSLDPEVEAAVASVADATGNGDVQQLGALGTWDVVISDPAHARDAFGLLRPGGWLLSEVPARAPGTLRALSRALAADGADVRRHWHLPNRRGASRIVSLDDVAALRATLSRHGGSATRLAAAAAARAVLAAGLSVDMLGGETSLLARRAGGGPTSGWPSLDPLATELEAVLGHREPSWILLTPRFPASAHVVLLVLAGAEPRLIAKISRLSGDDTPWHEAKILDDLARSGVPADAAPRLVASTGVAGHAVLIEEALHGRPLDRRLVRTDPARWINAVSRWLAKLPRGMPSSKSSLDALLRESLGRILVAHPGDRELAALVARTREALAPLEHIALPRVLEHGDLSHPNVLVNDRGELGVLDWEMARPDGLPLNDLCFYLGYVALATRGEDSNAYDGFEHVLTNPKWGAIAAVHAEANRVGIERAALPALIVACWARAVAGEARHVSQHTGSVEGERSRSRYHRLWEGSVDRQAQLRAVLL